MVQALAGLAAQSENGRVQNAGETGFGAAILPFCHSPSLTSSRGRRPGPVRHRHTGTFRFSSFFIIHLTLTPSFGRRQTGPTLSLTLFVYGVPEPHRANPTRAFPRLGLGLGSRNGRRPGPLESWSLHVLGPAGTPRHSGQGVPGPAPTRSSDSRVYRLGLSEETLRASHICISPRRQLDAVGVLRNWSFSTVCLIVVSTANDLLDGWPDEDGLRGG